MQARAPHDTSQHTVHRIEAFSDIVIGFCLAQLGLSLALPKSATDMLSVWESTTFFIAAFTFIALLWWLHHRTFSTFFVLNIPMVVMNFCVLCGHVLTLYFLESIVRLAGIGQNPATFVAMFVFTFAVVYALLGAMLLVGLVVRRAELSVAEMRWGIGQLSSIITAVIFGLGIGTFAMLGGHARSIQYMAGAAAIAIIVVRRLVVPRWLDRSVLQTSAR
jgi:uncharacterized membrane protein